MKIVESKDKEQPPEEIPSVRKFRWQPKTHGEAWAEYRLVKNGREAVCEAGVDPKWTPLSTRAFKAPKIKLKKFPVTISDRQWKPMKVKGVRFSSVTYGI